ncbi:magnesium and cobalt transport protein CorA [Arthrobacter sp. TMN-37]
MTTIDSAVYLGGIRTDSPASLGETFDMMHERRGMAWIGLFRPAPEEIHAVADEFDLHELSVEDALSGHQRAKLERYGDTLFLVLRPARYIDEAEKVEFGELHVFAGADFIVTVRHAEALNLARVRQRLEADPELLAMGPPIVLYAILDEVVDQYQPVVAGLQNDIDEIEDQLFNAGADVSRRIYDLSREVILFQRATQPLGAILEALQRESDMGGMDIEVERRLRDVHDHVLRIIDQVNAFRVLLQNALTVHATFIAQRQNDEMRLLSESGLVQNEEVKKISSWAAILFAPTLVGTIYGMNFEHIPELSWPLGYPFALALMVGMGIGLYLMFRRRGWL